MLISLWRRWGVRIRVLYHLLVEMNCVFRLMGGPIRDALRRADICWQLQSVGKIWSESSHKEEGSSPPKLLETQFLFSSNMYSKPASLCVWSDIQTNVSYFLRAPPLRTVPIISKGRGFKHRSWQSRVGKLGTSASYCVCRCWDRSSRRIYSRR